METSMSEPVSEPSAATSAHRGGRRTSGHVIVIGGGVAGLVAARDLARAGARVTVIESSDRVGGQVRTVDFADRLVDVGAEAIYVAPPHLSALVRELGLWDGPLGSQPVGSHHGHTLLGHPRGAQQMPAGLGPAGPTRIRPVLRSGMLSLPGLARAGLEPAMARLLPPLAPDQDISVGDFLAGRFGHEVVRRFVDPLLGSLHSGDVYRLSLRGNAPQLVSAAERRTSLIRRQAPRPTTSGPTFITWTAGLQTFVEALASDIEGHGGRIAYGVDVRQIVPAQGRWQVRTSEGGYETDAVVLATPSPVTAALLSPLTGTAEALREQRFASVVNLLVALKADQVFRHAKDRFPLRATRDTNGILLPSDAPWTMKAATFLSTKWPHLRRTTDGRDDNAFLVRISAGRVGRHVVDDLDDQELTATLLDDLHRTTGVRADVLDSRIVRWPSMPQCEVGHPTRVAALRAELAAKLPGLALAGGGVDGMGMASVVRSGQAAAATIATSLATPSH
ncbi:protoporphyrinogen oxidase [Raineyella fluvialis]|uniref:Coproporphyrinogen III oxidase n=1 Tax=Raineyella fluvialis TaxID=2662261 RepID=A0A5Q2FA58_9ACTN|nr:protoporphyrinogen oxidase [Raineyella fluvialis]QGF23568.1 protoporphyrinogen oxidase [Raineyella fluvialis]